jgi:hypothetical protein
MATDAFDVERGLRRLERAAGSDKRLFGAIKGCLLNVLEVFDPCLFQGFDEVLMVARERHPSRDQT